MESSETPKGGLTNQEVGYENKELQIIAFGLAKATREKGMGRLYISQRLEHGIPPYVDSFIQGDEKPNTKIFGLLPSDFPQSLMQRGEHRQVWQRKQYVPPTEEVEVEKRFWKIGEYHVGRSDESESIWQKRFGPVSRVVKTVMQSTGIPLTYNGKKGEPDWIRFDYYMPIYISGEQRSGSFAIMIVAVPPHIATVIDEQVTSNVYFPDAFFKALYPGYVGQDSRQNLRRVNATELHIRGYGATMPSILKYPESIPYSILKYPQPIPY